MLAEAGEVGEREEEGGGESIVVAGTWEDRDECISGTQSSADGRSMLHNTLVFSSEFTVLLPQTAVKLDLRRLQC